MSFFHEPNKTVSEYTGVISMEVDAVGSKSEREVAVLTSLKKKIRVFLVGDNPFDNRKVRALVGKITTAKGVWKQGTFRIEEYEAQPIEVIESQDPAEVLEEASEELSEERVLEEDEEKDNAKEVVKENYPSVEPRENDE